MAARDAARPRAGGSGRAAGPRPPAGRDRGPAPRPRCLIRVPVPVAVPTASPVPVPTGGASSSREAAGGGRETLFPARRRWRGSVSAVRVAQGFAASLSQKKKTTSRERKSVRKDGTTKEPMVPLQTSSTMRSVNSLETPWLQKMARLRPVREPERLWRRVTPDQSRDIIASVQCILDRENGFVRELDRYIRHNDFLNLRKKEIVYREWLKDVSEPLLQKIEDKMASESIEEMQKRKQEQFSQYLNYCNKKGYVTLDYFDPAEYDPFSMTTAGWKV